MVGIAYERHGNKGRRGPYIKDSLQSVVSTAFPVVKGGMYMIKFLKYQPEPLRAKDYD